MLEEGLSVFKVPLDSGLILLVKSNIATHIKLSAYTVTPA